MSKNNDIIKNKIDSKKQIQKLYIRSVLGNLSLTGAWVAILASRGFSLVEIGIAETVFHIVSLMFEIPSGVFADMFGRRNMLILSCMFQIMASITMIASNNLPMVCLSIGFCALGYNFNSGSGDALAYDSLKLDGNTGYYERFASVSMIIYRFCGGISTLCAGFAIHLGHKIAYGTDVVMFLIQILVLTTISEAGERIYRKEKNGGALTRIGIELIKCFRDSLLFLKTEKTAVVLMFSNSLVGAIDTLLLFFLQAKLKDTGIPLSLLGFALFLMEMGGILGAKLILRLKNLTYKSLFITFTMLVLSGVVLEHSGMWILMTLGGFITALSDDALQVRTNTMLQDMFPSEQRATLISMESFTFSVIMIVLSPLAGMFFSLW